jgi:hypothetical protein
MHTPIAAESRPAGKPVLSEVHSVREAGRFKEHVLIVEDDGGGGWDTQHHTIVSILLFRFSDRFASQ